jgi:O-antigen ligase
MFNKQFFILALLFVIASSFSHTAKIENFLFIQLATYIQLTISLLAAFVVIYLFLLKRSHSYLININPTDFIVLFLTGYVLIVFQLSRDYNYLYNPIIMFMIWGTLYFLIKRVVHADRTIKVKSLLYLFSLVGCFQIFYASLQYLDILPELFYHRYGGSFGNSGDLANFLAVTWSVSLGLFLWRRNNLRKWLLGVILLLHLFLLVISVARTAWIAVLVSTLYLLLTTSWVKNRVGKIHNYLRQKKWIIISLFLGFLTLMTFAGWKMYAMKSLSADGRLFIWQTCIQLIKEKPLFGHGYESFLTVQRNAQIEYFATHPEDLETGMLAANSSFAFNDFLQFAIEYGIVGLLLLITIFLLPFRKVTTTTDTDRQIVLTIRAAFIVLFVCALFSYPLQNQTIILLFVTFLAISSAYDTRCILSFKLTQKVKVPALIVFLGLSLLLLNFNIRKIENGLKWKQAHALSKSESEKAFELYSEIHDFMDHDRSFITNYGSIFYSLKEYDKLVEYYEKFGYLCTSSDILLMVGESYEKLENYDKAEAYYRKATNLIPHLFVPRYRLFKLYLRQGLDEKANIEAKKIRDLPIKVYSDKVKGIKTEVNEYLYNSSP